MGHALASKTGTVVLCWSGGTPTMAKMILVYCTGPSRGFDRRSCHHNARLSLDELPDCDWFDMSAYPLYTHCGPVGFVETRRDLSEVINFNKGIS
jgi:hypothetical protein